MYKYSTLLMAINYENYHRNTIKTRFKMMQVAFDTLKYSDDLKQAGVDPKLAETLARVQSEAFSKLIEDSLATKQDILLLKQDIILLKQEMTKLSYTLFFATIGVLGGLMTLLRFF